MEGFVMKWLKNKSIGAKLGFLAGLPLCLLLFSAAFNSLVSSRSVSSFETASSDVFSQSASITRAESALRSQESSILKMLIADDERKMKELLSDIEQRRKESADILAQFGNTPLDQAMRDHLDGVKNSEAELVKIQDDTLRLIKLKRTGEARGKFLNELEPITREYNDRLRGLSEYLTDMAGLTRDEITRRSDKVIFMNWAISLAAVILSAVFGLIVSKMITKPINAIREKIGAMAGGDLSVDFTDSGGDAVSLMSNALEEMAQTLRRVVSVSQDSGVRIADAARGFSSISQKANASLEEFRSNVEEFSSNMRMLASVGEEVNASVGEVAAGAQTTVEKGVNITGKINDAMSAGENGKHAVHNVTEGINEVSDSAAAATGAVFQLSDRTRQIQSFVQQIGSIANQTNLLALNAAIEAARAGETGRGFAVVAEEVRKLAEESNAAAKNIEGLAISITSDLATITSHAQENAVSCDNVKELSRETEDAIAKMLENLSEIATATEDLAAVAEEQAAASEEISESVRGMSVKIGESATVSDNIRVSVAEVASTSEKVAENAESLSRLSSDLGNELAFFKTNGGKDSRNASRFAGLRQAK
jgi:methyl-accepting chemotaxis protein